METDKAISRKQMCASQRLECTWFKICNNGICTKSTFTNTYICIYMYVYSCMYTLCSYMYQSILGGRVQHLSRHLVDPSSSSYYYNTYTVLFPNYCQPSFWWMPATPVRPLCNSPNTRSVITITLHIMHNAQSPH